MANEQDKEQIKKRLEEIDAIMSLPDFWSDKSVAQKILKEMKELRAELEGGSKYDNNPAIMTIVAGAGGDDAEDFARMLLEMYVKYAKNKNRSVVILHENKNDMGGYRNITAEFSGKGVFGDLKWENGVHRLVRKSPFNANQKRHTAFCLVDVVPLLDKLPSEIEINDKDIEISFARSSGPGGQNVNKRDTSVRIKHIPTGISVHVESERSQERNKEKAMGILASKLLKILEEKRNDEVKSFKAGEGMKINWGNQIRSYVLHPYKLIKDHRSSFEENNIDKILEDGELDEIISSVRNSENS